MIRLAYQFGSSVYSIRYMKYDSPQDLYSELCFVPFIYDDEVENLIDEGDVDYIKNGKVYRNSNNLENYKISSGIRGYLRDFYKSPVDMLYIFIMDEWYVYDNEIDQFVLLENYCKNIETTIY